MIILDFEKYSRKVKAAALKLRAACSTGDPTEEQVREATRSVDLPVTFESDSFVADPVRNAVFVAAYNPRLKAGWDIDKVIEHTYSWYKTRPAA